MFKIWGKILRDAHIVRDMVVSDSSGQSRTKKVFAAIEKICGEFDLGQPIWLDANIADFRRYSKVRFIKDNFVEAIDFDCLEIQVIEEDY